MSNIDTKTPADIYLELKNADKLERNYIVLNLTKVLQDTQSPFVMSINAPWGMGKTTMLKLWQAYLRTQEFECFCFSAWEHDFGSQPLVALIAQLKMYVNDFKNKGKEGSVQALVSCPPFFGQVA